MVSWQEFDAWQGSPAFQNANHTVDYILLRSGKHWPIYRDDCKPSVRGLPSICPKSEPKPPVELRPDGDLLAVMENCYRCLGVIGDGQSLHWVGRQETGGTTCTCDLMAPSDNPRPPRWHTLLHLRQEIRALLVSVRRWAGSQLPPGGLEGLDCVGQRVTTRIRALEWELPRFPQQLTDQGVQLHGSASLPVGGEQDGAVLMARAPEILVWEAEWRAILVAVEAQLAAMDPRPLACQPPASLQVDTSEVSMEAPAATPSPLREAFEAVAQALLMANEVRRFPQNIRSIFVQQANVLAVRWHTASDRYAAAELNLRAVADDDGRCAHHEALNAVRRVNGAVEQVMRGIVQFHRATAHILAVPAFDLAELLWAMRRQTSLAALRMRGTAAPPASQNVMGGQEGNREQTVCWLSLADAERLSGVNQGVISRAVDRGEIKSNNQKGRGRRKIDSADFNRWLLERSQRPERIEGEAEVERKLRRPIND